MEAKAANGFVPALVLNGGGARTAYQVGVIKALGEIFIQASCPFGIICGTSAGSINAGYLASRADQWTIATQDLAQIWSELLLEQIYETSGLSLTRISSSWISRTILGGRGANNQNSNYMLDTKPLSRLLSEKINFPAIHQHILKGNMQGVAITSVEYFEQMTVSFFDADPRFLEWSHSGREGRRCELEKRHVLASAAMPVFFPPVKIKGGYFGDGCLRQSSPLSPAIHLGADRIISVGIREQKKRSNQVSGTIKRESPALAEILGELFNALFLDTVEPDIERLERINDAIKNGYLPASSKDQLLLREIPILNLTPTRNLSELIPDILENFPLALRYFIKGLGASDSEDQGKELISYLAFTKECVIPLLSLGYKDTMLRKTEIQAFMNAK